MNVGEVIKQADLLYPNNYSLMQKLNWCHNVSCTIRNEINKQVSYKKSSIETLKNDIEEIGELNIKNIIIENHRYDVTDIMKWFSNDKKLAKLNGDIKIEYYLSPKSYRCGKYMGMGLVGRNRINTDEETNFKIGDFITVEYNGNKYEGTINSIKDGYLINNVTLKNYEGEMIITRRLDDELECQEPYNDMYVDYLLGKMCYYQSDYDSYNQHMSQYNNKMALYQKFIKYRKKQNSYNKLKGLWD